MKEKSSINWLNTIFIIATTSIGVFGGIIFAIFNLLHWQTLILAFILAGITGLSITAGYHRLCSHKSYKAKWPVRLFFSLMGAATFQGSILEWCTDHRNHHRYTDDVVKDPYSIKKGFWFAHVVWLFKLDSSKRDFSNVQDLAADPIYLFQHHYFPLIGAIFGFGLPVAIASLWGDVLGGLIIAGFLRLAFTYQMAFFINSLCHMMGKQTYSDLTARDNWLTAILTCGEGFHNFHHKFPIDYRNGVRAFHYDPTKWVIYFISRLGLAFDLKRIPQHRIIRNRLNTEATRLQLDVANNEPKKSAIQLLHNNIQQLLEKIEQIEANYITLKNDSVKYTKDMLKENRKKLKTAWSELNASLSTWKRTVQAIH